MQILINTPSLSLPGGVANHYKGLQPFFNKKIKYNIVGRRHGIPGPICLIYDYIKFITLITLGNYKVILLNPSLSRTALLRDYVFLRLAKLLNQRVIIFFHGWDQKEEGLIDRNPDSFRQRFNKADAFIVLANAFASKLNEWGLKSPIYLSSTKVDDKLIRNFDLEKKKYDNNVLFLARIESNKGIFLAIESFSEIIKNNPEAQLIIAGSGSATESAIKMVEDRQIANVKFLGNITGDLLVKTFSEADIYILPTTHGEGMPTSVLEAMAFGLPIITRPIGGLKDFFINERMGFISESLDPQWYAEKIKILLSDHELIKRIGRYNNTYASEHFLASKVAQQLEEILEGV